MRIGSLSATEFVMALAGVLASWSVVAAAGAERPGPSLSVRHSLNLPGTPVPLHGIGFDASPGGVRLYLDSAQGPYLSSAQVTGGAFNAKVVLPPGTAPGPHTIVALGVAEGASSVDRAEGGFTLVDRGGPSERVTLRFDHGKYELIEKTTAGAKLPPSDDLPKSQVETSGFWYELQSTRGDVLYRRIIADPVLLVSETKSHGPGAKVERAEAVPEQRVFSLLIPRPVEGDRLVIFSSPTERGAQTRPAKQVARIRF
jgi:hypothetical protein